MSIVQRLTGILSLQNFGAFCSRPSADHPMMSVPEYLARHRPDYLAAMPSPRKQRFREFEAVLDQFMCEEPSLFTLLGTALLDQAREPSDQGFYGLYPLRVIEALFAALDMAEAEQESGVEDL